jgi:pyridoxamine 5'-phosphate oxidase
MNVGCTSGSGVWSRDAALEHTNRIWALAERGVVDRRSVWRTPTIATQRCSGQPDLRTMVLRGASRASWTLQVHTDCRSEKICQLQSSPHIAVHVYDSKSKQQVRIAGLVTVHRADQIADSAWAATPPGSRVGYAQDVKPGQRLERSDGTELRPARGHNDAAARAHFTVLMIHATSLDWLLLATDGHRRALFERDGAGEIAGHWLAP